MKMIRGIAVACIATTGAAYAQSSVTIYGIADAALGVSSAGKGNSLPDNAGTALPSKSSSKQLYSGVGPASRLGFRGAEDLGDGMKATFQLEMGFDLSTGALQQGGLAWGRQSYLGLSKDNISVTLGRQYGALFWALVTADPLGGAYWGNVTNQSGHGTYAAVGSAPGSGTYQSTARVDNSAMMTWAAGPVTTRLMVAAGNETSRGSGRQLGGSVSYNQGPLMLNAGYTRMRTPDSMLPASATSAEWMNEAVVAGSYDFGAAKLFAGAYQFKGPKDRSVMAPQLAANPFAYGWEKTRTYWLGARVPFGANSLTLSAARHSFDYASSQDGTSTTLAAVYEHLLSKRTAVYASLARVKNNAIARTSLFGATSFVGATGYGSDLSALSLGLRHAF